jgi:hypothetical protein
MAAATMHEVVDEERLLKLILIYCTVERGNLRCPILLAFVLLLII